MLTFNLSMIKDRFFKSCGSIVWNQASLIIDYNLAVMTRMIMQSDLRIGVKLSCGSFHALNLELTQWREPQGSTIDSNLPELFAQYGTLDDIADLQCDEEYLEDLLTP